MDTAKKIPLLNGLRGLAIIGVVFQHLVFPKVRYGLEGFGKMYGIETLLSSGWLGVNLFFFLSGIVLYLPYARSERRIDGGRSVFAFYLHRMKRLAPLYWIVCLVSLIFFASFQLNDPRFYQWGFSFATVSFIFQPATFFPAPNRVLWSLGVEIWFSVLFPGIVLLISRFGMKRVFIGVLLLSFATRLAGQFGYGEGDPRILLNVVSDSVLGRLDEFLWGMLLAYCLARRSGSQVFTRPLALAGIGTMLLSLLMWGLWYRHEYPRWTAAINVSLFDFGMFAVTGFLLVNRQAGWLQSRLLQLLGMMCYSLYVWHAIILDKFVTSIHSAGTYCAYIALVLVLGWLSYRYIEFGHEKDWRKLLPAPGTPEPAALEESA